MVLPALTLEDVDYQFQHRYDNRQQWIYGNIAFSLLLAYAAVILRFVARRKRGLKIAWNDYTIVLGLVSPECVVGGIFSYSYRSSRQVSVLL